MINKKEIIMMILNHDVQNLEKHIQTNNIKDLSFTDEKGNSLLHLASHNKSENTFKLFKLLTTLKCDLNSVNENFETPLEYAIKNKNDMATFILKALEIEREICN